MNVIKYIIITIVRKKIIDENTIFFRINDLVYIINKKYITEKNLLIYLKKL